MSKYSDIIDLPHFHDPARPYMSIHDRAAQFAPYKSLVGYEEMLSTTAEEILATDIRSASADVDTDVGADADVEFTPVSGT